MTQQPRRRLWERPAPTGRQRSLSAQFGEPTPIGQGACPGRPGGTEAGASSGRAPGWRIRSGTGRPNGALRQRQRPLLRPPGAGQRPARRARLKRSRSGEAQRTTSYSRGCCRWTRSRTPRPSPSCWYHGGHRRGRVLLPEPSLVRSHRERRQAHGRPGGDPGHHARGRHGFPAAPGNLLAIDGAASPPRAAATSSAPPSTAKPPTTRSASSRRATSSRSRTGQTRPRRSSPPRRKCPSRAWRTTTGTGRCTSTFPA